MSLYSVSCRTRSPYSIPHRSGLPQICKQKYPLHSSLNALYGLPSLIIAIPCFDTSLPRTGNKQQKCCVFYVLSGTPKTLLSHHIHCSLESSFHEHYLDWTACSAQELNFYLPWLYPFQSQHSWPKRDLLLFSGQNSPPITGQRFL